MAAALRAYHGNPAIKEMYVARMKGHMRADALTQKFSYWNAEVGKGCAVGCTLHERGQERIGSPDDLYEMYETKLGIPRQLAGIEENIFEGGTVEISKTFPLAFLEAIPVGADLSEIEEKLVQSLSRENPAAHLFCLCRFCLREVGLDVSAVADKLLELLRSAPVDRSVVMQPLNVVLDEINAQVMRERECVAAGD